MEKHLIISFALVCLTLAQWDSLEHGFHMHAPGELSGYCLSAKPLDHGLITTSVILPGGYSISAQAYSQPLTTGHRSHQHYPLRAPPLTA